MTHLINYDHPNLFLLNGNTAVYFTPKENFEKEDTVILQDGRSETKYEIVDILEAAVIKKNTVMISLSKQDF